MLSQHLTASCHTTALLCIFLKSKIQWRWTDANLWVWVQVFFLVPSLPNEVVINHGPSYRIFIPAATTQTKKKKPKIGRMITANRAEEWKDKNPKRLGVSLQWPTSRDNNQQKGTKHSTVHTQPTQKEKRKRGIWQKFNSIKCHWRKGLSSAIAASSHQCASVH